MATYTELADFVKDWSNRDLGVLEYKTIRQCIRYAHDETYRTLRIAPLEITRVGTVTAAQVAQGYLTIEDDLVEFIQLRKRADEGPRSYSSFDKPYIVAEAHSDARSFNGDTVTLYSDYAFYREGTQIHIFPLIQEGEVWELFYYRRLPEVNERFEDDEVRNLFRVSYSGVKILGITSNATAAITFDTDDVKSVNNIAVDDVIRITGVTGTDRAVYNTDYTVTAVSISGTTITVTTDVDTSAVAALTEVSGVNAAWSNISVTREQFDRFFEPYADITQAMKDADPMNLDAGIEFSTLEINVTDDSPDADDLFIGILKEHWLRDTNEKVLLFGALHQAFDYLDEADQSAKYKGKFEQEIAKLNKEEMDRMNSGGNINVNFYNRLI